MNNLSPLILTLIFVIGIACTPQKQQNNEEYISAVDSWHRNRVAALMQEDSWLSLAGLYRLEEGTQTIGADSSNDIVFPSGTPPRSGTLTFQDGIFTLSVHPGAEITHKGTAVSKIVMRSDEQGEPTVVHQGSFLWYIIERRGNYYLRLKNTAHSNFASFTGIERFPVSKKWNIKAEFIPYDEPRLISIPDVLGYVYQDTLYGILEFTINDSTFRLSPLGHPTKDEQFFIILGDETNGESTYGGGRYLYVDTPGADGLTYIDFNKAYNPPCVFTRFATCPLPPAQNRLSVKIKAGEKMYEP